MSGNAPDYNTRQVSETEHPKNRDITNKIILKLEIMATRIALVTGGMGGLGEAICIRLASVGYRVVPTYSTHSTKSNEWLEKMSEKGFDFSAYACDVSDFSSCQRCVEQIENTIGCIDVLVNNAGLTRDKTFRNMTPEDWNKVMRTNLDSMFNMTKQVYEGMVERRWGRIINIASVNATKGAFGQVNYAAAKAGVLGFTKALALEGAKHGVTVNAISPGYFETPIVASIPQAILDTKILPQIPVGRMGQPKEVAALVSYLASEDASFVTGANVGINGGQFMG